tara:strand:+ start:282 stop:440 length:159 start_codon:yes stop_codon:yes gene_type:complete
MTRKQIDEVLQKLNLVLEDIQMLRDGSWEPDEKSCNATLGYIEDCLSLLEDL